jgi:hypothetical protein
MPSQTPTHSNVRWGSDAWSLCDIYLNPTRITGGNPVVFVRHAGGGTVGTYTDARDTATGGDEFYFYNWLNGRATDAVGGASPSLKWDIVHFTSGQETWSDLVLNNIGQLGDDINRSRSVYFPDAIRDCQRAIASIKSLGSRYGFDPNKVITYGNSHGATLTGLSQLAPPLLPVGGKLWMDSGNCSNTHDSRVRGCVLNQPQVKCDLTHMGAAEYAAWFGMRGETISSCTWTNGTLTLAIPGSYPGGFAGAKVGDRVLVSGGTGVTTGYYTIASITGRLEVVLTASITGGSSPSDVTIVPVWEFDRIDSRLRDASSMTSYFEQKAADFYPGFFNFTVNEIGDHIKPYANSHDSGQIIDLRTAVEAAGLTIDGYTSTGYAGLPSITSWAWVGASWPTINTPGKTGLIVPAFLPIETWMASKVA